MKDELRRQYIKRIRRFTENMNDDGLKLLYRLAASLYRSQVTQKGKEDK